MYNEDESSVDLCGVSMTRSLSKMQNVRPNLFEQPNHWLPCIHVSRGSFLS